MLSLRIDIHPRKIWLDSVKTTSTSFTKRLVIVLAQVQVVWSVKRAWPE